MENILWMGGRWILIGNVSHLFINAQECDLAVMWPWISHLGDVGQGLAAKLKSRGRRA